MPVKFCLNMIITDETPKITYRCLDNVKALIDALVINYNGTECPPLPFGKSNPNSTVGVIEKFMTDNDIPGLVTRSKWVDDFGYSRSLAIDDAENYLSEKQGYGLNGPVSQEGWKKAKTEDTWYLLFMDADNQVFPDSVNVENRNEKAPKFTMPQKQQLNSDKYIVNMTQNTTFYAYTWLAKVDYLKEKRWNWEDPLHEFVSAVGGWSYKQDKITGCYILSGREGIRNNDPLKYLKDAYIFEKYFAKLKLKGKNPTPRNIFYAGNSWKDAVYYDQAIKYYKQRVTMSDWAEEVYISYLQIGKLTEYLHPEKKYEVMEYFYRAMSIKPGRLEAPFYIVEAFRRDGLYHAGWALAKSLIDTPFPSSDSLFVENEVHQWKFLDSAAVCAFYAGDKIACKKLNERAINSGTIPKDQIDRILKNLSYCN